MSFAEFLSYGFVQRALIGGVLIGITTAMLGIFLVLKRLSLIGDSLSHVALSGVAAGLLLKVSPLFAALPIVVLSGVAVFKITKNNRVYADAALGIISAAGIAIGLIIAALAGGFNTDLMGFLFGSILTVSFAEVLTAAALLLITGGVIYIFYDDLLAVIFDEHFAEASGLNVSRVNLILIILTACTVVMALKVVGILLVSALIVIPPSAALQFAKNFRMAVIWACVISALSVVAGIILSFFLDLPAGAVIIILNLIVLIFTMAAKNYADKKRTDTITHKKP